MFHELFDESPLCGDKDYESKTSDPVGIADKNAKCIQKYTHHCHRMKTLPISLKINLISEHHSLWAHCLWNSGIALAGLLESSLLYLCKGKTVIELGCGAGLPSLAAYCLGASQVLMTEYPESVLLDVVKENISANKILTASTSSIEVMGLRWGDRQTIYEIRCLHPTGFDLVILSDLIFNHSQHIPLLASVSSLVSEANPSATILVAFSHHRPNKIEEDLNFFKLAATGRSIDDATENDPFPGLTFRPFKISKLDSVLMCPMFENDYGDPLIRSQVHIYSLSCVQE